jgi:predicted MFS family arabinose efflux permease
LIRMSFNLGWTIGPALGGWLAMTVGYYTLFIVDGITCIAAAFLFLFLLKNQPPEKTDTIEQNAQLTYSSAFKDRTFMAFLLFTTLGAIVFMQLLSTLPVFYKQELHMSEASIGLLMAMNGLVIVLIEMPSVFYLERKFHPLNLISAGILLYGFSYYVFNLAGWTYFVAVISMLALTIGEIINMPFTNSFAFGRAKPSNRGQYMGLYTMSYSLSHITAPALGMQIASKFGFGTLWWILGGISVVTYLGYMSLKKKDV